MLLDHHPAPGVTVGFGTPVLMRRLDGVEALNRALAEALTARERSEIGEGATGRVRRSGIGGWRTGDDYLATEEAAELRRMLADGVGEMMALAGERAGAWRIERLYGWANVNRDGDYNTVHSHPESHWSGVYYVATGEAAPGHPFSGVIELHDPRGAAQFAPVPGFDFGAKLRVVPEPGLLLIFPSWLLHMVHPFVGTGARISVAFNARIGRDAPPPPP